MIVFDFKCICGCQFEGWFSSRTEYEHQDGDSLITCPQCGSNEIQKIMSPVAIHSGSSPHRSPEALTEHSGITLEQKINLLHSIQTYVETNFEDVGPMLAKESLKIHYGVVEPKNIRGVATVDEEKMLLKEGIELLKIPMVKKTPGSKLN